VVAVSFKKLHLLNLTQMSAIVTVCSTVAEAARAV